MSVALQGPHPLCPAQGYYSLILQLLHHDATNVNQAPRPTHPPRNWEERAGMFDRRTTFAAATVNATLLYNLLILYYTKQD